MKSVKLPVQKPLITTYQHHAFPISIAMNHPDFMNWFCSNYIQICFPKVVEMNPLNYYSFSDYFKLCPLIDKFSVEKELVLAPSSANDFFIDAINRKFYLVTFIDEYYIPYAEPYMNWHIPHDILLYGYDLSTNSFFTSGFNKNRRYSDEQRVLFSNFNQAVNITEETDPENNHSEWSNIINLLKVNKDASYKFEIAALKESVYDYLHSTNSSNRYMFFKNSNDNIYGVAIYSILDQILIAVPNLVDIRMFHLIWEHKKNMNIRINYLVNNLGYSFDKDLNYKLLKIESEALIIKNMIMKYNLKRDPKFLLSIREKINQLMHFEMETLFELLEEL